MDKFGIRFTQKYDFEAVKLVVKDLNEKENTKRKAEAKAKKLAEEKAKREAEEKTKRKT